jgi:hypothetical protein
MWDGVKNSGSRRITSSLTRRHAMKGNGVEGKIPPKGKGPNNFKARVSNPKEVSLRKGFLSKGANPKEMLVGSLKEHVLIAMKWGITPKIAPNPNQKMGVLR